MRGVRTRDVRDLSEQKRRDPDGRGRLTGAVTNKSVTVIADGIVATKTRKRKRRRWRYSRRF